LCADHAYKTHVGKNPTGEVQTMPGAKITRGRPKRKTPTELLHLQVATKAKRRAYQMATDRGISVGRLFEYLIDRIDGDPFRPVSK
jgi:hypothetical protein